jgi:hypothetical protein
MDDPLTQIKVNLRERMEKFRVLEEFYRNAQLFCACHRYRDDHECNFVGAI